MTYLVMWKIGEEIWRTYTTDSLKTDKSFDLISRYGKVES